MKAANMSMLSLSLLVAGLTALAGGTAAGSPRSAVVRAQHAGPSSKVVSRAHQATGTPHKASSFAPHPTTRRVFGAPIQAPIVSNNVAPAKKTAPK